MVLVGYEGDGITGLERWFIEARESPTCIRRLHLCGCDILGTSILVFVGGSIESRHLLVKIACEAEADLSLSACRYRFVKRDLCDLGVLIVFDLGRGGNVISSSCNLSRMYIDFKAVQRD